MHVEGHHITVKRELFTPTEIRLLDLLGDGKIHAQRSLINALGDVMADKDTLSAHVNTLRSKLMNHYDINILHKLEGRRVSYVLARTLVVRTGE